MSASKPKNEYKVVTCEIFTDGKSLDSEILEQITVISIDLGLDKTGMLTLEMESHDEEKDQSSWMDDVALDVGKEIEVKLGYDNKTKTVFFGDIMGINNSSPSDRSPAMTVRAYDRRHRLERETENRQFEKMKYSDIAKAIAGYSGLSSQADDSKVVHEHVEKNNQSDLAFLEKLAAEINYRVMVVGKSLLFGRVAIDASEIMTFSLFEDLMDFSADLSLAGQASEVVVRGWDPAKKEEIVGRAATGSETSKMGGKESASQLSKKYFGNAIEVISNHQVRTHAEADQIALARLDHMAMGLIEASGKIMGTTDLVPGKVIKITGAGKRFSGRYYVEGVTHRIDQQEGYTTNFTARRNAL
jgi:phage protein D